MVNVGTYTYETMTIVVENAKLSLCVFSFDIVAQLLWLVVYTIEFKNTLYH